MVSPRYPIDIAGDVQYGHTTGKHTGSQRVDCDEVSGHIGRGGKGDYRGPTSEEIFSKSGTDLASSQSPALTKLLPNQTLDITGTSEGPSAGLGRLWMRPHGYPVGYRRLDLKAL
jgi:hypothetical protein